MIIGIEGQRLFRKKKHGMDMVALELIKNLQEIDKENQYYVFVKPDEDDGVLKDTKNCKVVKLDGGSYPKWEQIALPKAAKKYNCDILHCTSNTAPLFSKVPLMITLHDIIYMESSFSKILKSSSTSYQKFGNIYRKLVVPRILNKSKKIITVSNFEKNRIAGFFGISSENDRLEAVYNGVGTHFKKITDKEELLKIKSKYKLPDNYVFFLGNTDPKKNTKGTLKAFSNFLKQTNIDYKLVMLDYDLIELEKLLIEINDTSLIDKIVLTGYVANTDLPAIYSQAELFLYPSLRESFGIPMLEAMKCGVPVITSNTSSMPEIAQDAAHIVNPYNPDEITAGMLTIINDSNYKNDLIEKGFKRSDYFSWKNMAIQVLEIYKKMYNQKNN